MRGYLKSHAARIGLGLILLGVLFGHAAKFFQIPLLNQFDSIIYDYRLRFTMPGTVDDRIVIVDVDEKSLKDEGRWPWSRNRLALLLDKLFDRYQAEVVGFDIVFAERDESSGLRVLERLAREDLRDVSGFHDKIEEIAPGLDYDRLFATSMKGRRVVLGYYLTGLSETSGKLPPPVFPAGSFDRRPIEFTRWTGYGANLPEFQNAAALGGHFNPLPDPQDGVVRRVPLVAEHDGAYYEALSLSVVRALLGFASLYPGLAGDAAGYGGLEWLELKGPQGELRIPVDQNVCAMVPFRGREGSFPYVSASDVLNDRVDPDVLRGKIVLVGATAPGLLDLRSTPVQATYPGVEIHANLISGMLDQTLKIQPSYVIAAESLVILASGLVLVFLMPVLSPVRAALATLAVLSVVVGVNVAVWQYGNMVLPLAGALVLVAGLFALNMSWGYFVEARGKRLITGLFGRYVSPALVDEMARDPERISMEGESREMTVLFSDIRGFTRISERMDPRELSRFMNEFLTPLTEVIYRHRGTVDKYMGDCIMAFWGAPLPDAGHARNAVLAGMEMQETLRALNPAFLENGWPAIRAGIGINTGVVRVGNMGSQMRVTYTVMGDAVNLASRLEGITKQYGVDLVVGQNTRDAMPDFLFRELDRVRVKGKDEPVALFEPLGHADRLESSLVEEVALFHEGLGYYRARDWQRAQAMFSDLARRSPGAELYRVFCDRVAYLSANPPGASWDGVWTFEIK